MLYSIFYFFVLVVIFPFCTVLDSFIYLCYVFNNKI